MKNTKEVQEQLQEDLMTFLDGQDQEVITEVCNIVVRNMKGLDPTDREKMVAKLGELICDDEDLYESMDEALTLLEEQAEKDATVDAGEIVMMWEPLADRGWTVGQLLDEL